MTRSKMFWARAPEARNGSLTTSHSSTTPGNAVSKWRTEVSTWRVIASSSPSRVHGVCGSVIQPGLEAA
jgi:hypothetical protein